MRFLLGLIVGLLIGWGGYWFIAERDHSTASDARGGVGDSLTETRRPIFEKGGPAELKIDEIKDELARTGKVIRQKAQVAGHAIADATADARTTASIKGKLIADRDLSALTISVNTTDGLVTLSGTVSSVENIRKAMQLALDTDGVKEVASTLQVK